MLFQSRAAFGLLALAIACAPIAAEAQTKKITAPSATIPIQGIAFGSMGEPARPVTDEDGLPVRIISGGGSGGGGGGDASAAKQDIGNTALGAPGAPVWSGAGDGSLISISKSIRGLLAGGLAVTGTFYPAVQPSSVADGSDIAIGSTGAVACATDNGACALTALAKRTNQRITSLITAVGTPLQAGGSVVVSTLPATSPTLAAQNSGNASLASIDTKLSDVASGADIVTVVDKLDAILTATEPVPVNLAALSTGGCTPFGPIVSTVSTNSTLVIAGVRTLCSLDIVNTGATVAYVRLYDTATAPTCSSSTGAKSSRPALATGGIAPNLGPYGVGHTAGIAMCITGGGSTTDITNAPAGVYVNGSYK